MTGDNVLKRTRAILVLSAAHQQTIPFIKARLEPAPLFPAQAKHLTVLIARLSHDSYPIRHQATKALEKMGKSAEPALRLALRGTITQEGRRRLEILLYRLQGTPPSPEQLQAELTAEVLERIGTPEAQAVLAWLARGAPPCLAYA